MLSEHWSGSRYLAKYFAEQSAPAAPVFSDSVYEACLIMTCLCFVVLHDHRGAETSVEDTVPIFLSDATRQVAAAKASKHVLGLQVKIRTSRPPPAGLACRRQSKAHDNDV